MLKWFLLLLSLYVGAVFITSISGNNSSEKAWGFILGAMVYAFVYAFALLPALLLVLNKERKSTILYLFILIICAGCMVAATVLGYSMDGSFSIFLSLFTPYCLIFSRTIYDWYMGYESENWDGY